MRFVDTNILLHAVSTAAAERSKSRLALSLLEAEDLALSVQVLQEFYVQAARSLGCETVLSEDLNEEQDYAGVRVVNPFRARRRRR